MKLNFTNLGPLKEAEMELKALTILSGKNNTGKSYLAHSVWYAQRAILNSMFLELPSKTSELIEIISEGFHFDSFAGYVKSLPKVEGMLKNLFMDDGFADSKVKLIIPDEEKFE